MRIHEKSRVVLATGVFVLMGFAGSKAAYASPPANDNFADADSISTLPFTDTGTLGGTTTEPGEPQFCSFQTQTVWYTFTPSSTVVIRVDVNAGGPVTLNIYRSFGGAFGGLGFMGCTGGGSTTVTADADTTYYLQVGSGGQMTLNVAQIPPPAHDDVANAIEVGSLPFADSADITAATTQAGEPLSPGGSPPIAGSVWYTHTATGPEALTASTSFCCTYPVLAVYTGDSVTSLTEVASRFAQPLTFRPAPGTTYYIQVGRGSSFGSNVAMSFRLELTPPPVVNFGAFPSDPSTFELAQFQDFSYDPGQAGIESQAWDFGDGATGTGCCTTHRYAADGDYTVTLTVTTYDGRTASDSRLVPVRTHDVAISRFSVPSSASVNQTRALSVGVSNVRYPDTVQVQLFKSAPGSYNGFELVGTLTQLAPVLSKNQTIPFDFSYTFTSDDAAIGKVTFQAIATILGARDAQGADNTAIALPTRVRP